MSDGVNNMKAIVYEKYGMPNSVSVKEVEKPKVKEGHVLIRIHSASINQADLYLLQGKPFPLRFSTGLLKPKNNILGSDMSGVIEEVGEGVEDYKVGDEVFGELFMNQDGGYAEYALAVPKQIYKKPKNISHSMAASTPMAALTAIQGLRLAEVNEKSRILIYGASGGVGTFFIQVAKSLGAHVTAVCSTRNIDVAKESKADVIIDYKKEIWDKDNIQYDVVVVANGYNKISRYRDALKSDGTYLLSGGTMRQLMEFFLFRPFLRKKENRKFLNYVAKVSSSDLKLISELLESNQLRPFIDEEFPLSKASDALEHFYTGKTIGKTVIKIV